MEARDEQRLLRLQAQLDAAKLFIIEELGYVPLSQTGAKLLFEIFSRRHERGSTIVTSNLPFARTYIANAGTNGRQQDITLGLNWYPDVGFAVQANWRGVMNIVAPLRRMARRANGSAGFSIGFNGCRVGLEKSPQGTLEVRP